MAMIYPAPQTQHNQYYQQNISTLQWPKQTLPGPAAWKQWREFISWAYLQPDSMHLQQPLGQWLPSYNQDFEWKWQVFPWSYYLFHYQEGQWWAFSPVRHYHTHVGYSRHPSPTSIPTGTVPATPILFPYKIHVTLPLSQIKSNPLPTYPYIPLATRLVTPPVEWARPLWNDIRPHAHMDTLRVALLTKT